MLSGLKLATQSLLGRYRNILSKIVWFYEVIGVFLQPERQVQSQCMRCLPCGKVDRQRDHKANTAYIVGWNLLLDSRWIHYRAISYTRVRSKATAPFFEYTKNFKRNQSSTKPRTDWALFSYWNRLTWTPNHARHWIKRYSIDYATLFDEDRIERNLLAIAIATYLQIAIFAEHMNCSCHNWTKP